MPLPPKNPYRRFRCTACGWSKTVLQRTDELDFCHSCPNFSPHNLRIEKTLHGELYEQYLKLTGRSGPKF
ncbi:MAG: hypothetical protein RL260_3538 [Pseudomonadota bacterium]|jgi:predicted nucleic acid-binding Zn ribbon protein